jgi:hypothetical protein
VVEAGRRLALRAGVEVHRVSHIRVRGKRSPERAQAKSGHHGLLLLGCGTAGCEAAAETDRTTGPHMNCIKLVTTCYKDRRSEAARTACTLRRHPGAVAEWLRSGLQSRVHRFDSGRRLSWSREQLLGQQERSDRSERDAGQTLCAFSRPFAEARPNAQT